MYGCETTISNFSVGPLPFKTLQNVNLHDSHLAVQNAHKMARRRVLGPATTTKGGPKVASERPARNLFEELSWSQIWR